jgi:hypothetical protein
LPRASNGVCDHEQWVVKAYKFALPAFASSINGITDYAIDGDRLAVPSPEKCRSTYQRGLIVDGVRTMIT